MANLLLLAAAMQIDEEEYNLYMLRRQLRDVSDPLSIPEATFRGLYRISRQCVHDMIVELGPFIPDPVRNTISIPKKLKFIVALHFFSQGCYQKSAGQDFLIALSQASVSRCVDDVVEALQQWEHLVKFPTSEEELMIEKQHFLNVQNGFPGIIGCIDCTHVAIVAPPTNDPHFPGILFYNRKGFYSLNVQIICNANLKILNINARYPGSVHDSAIWTTSLIRGHLEANADNRSWLLGDSGYPLQPWLITPILAPATEGEQRFNNAHKSVRNVVERLNGVLKGRFRCLLRHRALHYHPIKAAHIINSCAILHNYIINREDHINFEYIEENIDNEQENVANVNNNIINRGRNIRNRIVQMYFD